MTPVALHTRRWGQGRRRVLLVHGLSSDAMTWWRLAPAVAALGVEVVAPDLRGHGRSPRAATYRLADHVADLRLLGGGWDVAVGHSFGGSIVAAAAASSGGFAANIVLVDPLFEIADGAFASVVARQVAELATDAERLLAANPGWHEDDARHKAAAVAAADPVAVERCLTDNQPWQHLDLLAALPGPVLAIGADPQRGALFTAAQADRAGVDFVLAAGSGHSVHRDDPDLVTDAIASQLRRDET